MAHVDHGKTTTTEQMLVVSGVTSSAGLVDEGTTVMDHMDQERERGITIQAAAISFSHDERTTINLIDTPGHLDFTSEVERSARVLDGAVVVIDAVAGVQAQTITVWQQADRHNLSRIVFINKLDRTGASLEHVLGTMRERLGVTPLVIHLPVDEGPDFASFVDLVTMELVTFPSVDAHERQLLEPGGNLHEAATEARELLVSELAEFDDEVADHYLSEEADAGASLSADALDEALRRVTLRAQPATVVLCGAAYRAKGIAPLLDGVVKYLPSPLDVPVPVGQRVADGAEVPVPCDGDASSVTGLAFKVQHHAHRGALVFLRVFAGTLRVGDKLSVAGQPRRNERVQQLMRLCGDDFEQVDTIPAGHIGAAVGLRQTRSGDTLVTQGAPNPVVLHGVDVPPPVFTVAAEASSATEQAKLDEALAIIVLEDPSVQVTADEELGQTLIGGMGELHLEVVLERLRSDFKLDTLFGKVRVAFKETVRVAAMGVGTHDVLVDGKRQFAQVGAEVFPVNIDEDGGSGGGDDDGSGSEELRGGKLADSSSTRWSSEQNSAVYAGEAALPPPLAAAVAEGIDMGLRRGVLYGSPTTGVGIRLCADSTKFVESDASPAAYRAAACKAVREAITNASPVLLEPFMAYTARLPADYAGDVLADLNSKRRGEVHNVATVEGFAGRSFVEIEGGVPLSLMMSYAADLQAMTKGEASFNISFERFRPAVID